MVNGQREMLPVITGDLMVRKASSSFLVIQAFGAQLMWYLDGPLLLITLQPGFAHKVNGKLHFCFKFVLWQFFIVTKQCIFFVEIVICLVCIHIVHKIV